MLVIGEKVKLRAVVVSQAKCLLEEVAGGEGEVDVRDCGVDESGDAVAAEQIVFRAVAVDGVDSLDANDYISLIVRGKRKCDVIGLKFRCIVAAQSQAS